MKNHDFPKDSYTNGWGPFGFGACLRHHSLAPQPVCPRLLGLSHLALRGVRDGASEGGVCRHHRLFRDALSLSGLGAFGASRRQPHPGLG